ncbi:MAG: glycine cleavage system protein T [SAR86 cluster bacterium]|uniref:aminomethyltransferase n=1 Tax=SAR86 cluster bacterium TaxID=2030880 RepID=A0A2A5CI63_9GAMM|nr:glycine cleavage system aminomethyltransferase GcvT [Gammaproteobacteria bacterium AH-315-E17]PCJ43472.1 MAG: glycine cleavage system protein T [SAR86 cluster bacterium]
MNLKQTPLYDLHEKLGAKLVPFAGYAMPVSYPLGIIKEHQHTREQAGLFDVSHMGQLMISGAGVVEALEALVPVDLEALAINQQSYAVLTNEKGGVIDDLMITRIEENKFFLVINAACKEKDISHLRANLQGLEIQVFEDQALLALQGPAAKDVMARYIDGLDSFGFMWGMNAAIEGINCYINRAGYTGEDGFEISVKNAEAEKLATLLLANSEVEAVGLGARDSLRLESGLCLYGHELNEDITPIEAGLIWSISKSRREGGSKVGGFLGAKKILEQIQNGASIKRVGLKIDGRVAAREGAELLSSDGEVIGEVSSGGFGPTIGSPVAIGFIKKEFVEPGTKLQALVRKKSLAVEVCKLPFVQQRYFRI